MLHNTDRNTGLVCHFNVGSVPACWLFGIQTMVRIPNRNGPKRSENWIIYFLFTCHLDGLPNHMNSITQIQNLNTWNIWKTGHFNVGIQMVRFSNGWAITTAIVWTIWKLIIQNGHHFVSFQMVWAVRFVNANGISKPDHLTAKQV